MFIKLTYDASGEVQLVNMLEVKRIYTVGALSVVVFTRRGSSEMWVQESLDEIQELIDAEYVKMGYARLYAKAEVDHA